MVKIDAIEGTAEDVLWYHYDLTGDVLYLRLAAMRDAAAYAEETHEGILLLRAQQGDQPVGLTIVNWWRRFGSGQLPDSRHQIEKAIEPWVSRLAA